MVVAAQNRTYRSIKPLRQKDRQILEHVVHSIKIADALGEPLWLGDENHRTIYVNPVYEKISGYSLQECIGQPADFCFDEESKRTIAEHHKLRAKGISSQYEATILSRDGKKVPVLVSGAPTNTGGTIGIFIQLSKIKELSQKERVAQQILKHSAEAFVVLDQNRKIVIWNKAAEKMFDYKEEEMLNKSVDIIIPKEEAEANQQILQEVEEKKFVKNVEQKRIRKDGTLVDVSISVTKIIDEKGNFIDYLVIYRDITQQKRTNTELQKRFEAIQDAYKELGLQKRHLDYMYEIISSATSTENIEDLERIIVSAMSLLTKADGAVLRTYDKKHNLLKLASCFGVSKKWWDKSQINYENSIAKEAFENNRPLIIDDIDVYSKHQGTKLLKSNKFKTLILIPLIMSGRFIGSLSLYSSDPAKFRLIETDFLENMGKQCSLALFAKSKVTE